MPTGLWNPLTVQINMKRLLYLGYYFKELDHNKLNGFIKHAKKSKGSTVSLWSDAISSSLKYNISILDYFYFKFYELSEEERKTFAGTGFMYEYQLKMNPKAYRDVLEDKILFLEKYKKFVRRKNATIQALSKSPQLVEDFLSHSSGKLVAKGSKGQVGAEVKVISTKDFTADSLLKFMTQYELDLLEEYVVQHPDLMRLSPSGLNTLRVFTQIKNGKVHYLGARLRITVNSSVDNMAAGNPAAPINMETGIVEGPAVFSDIAQTDALVHPVTGVDIVGFKIPYWDEIVKMAEEAAFVVPENRSIGWDIAITEEGVELIEGNHNWCKLLWQLPVKRGLKTELAKFVDDEK